MVKSCKGVTGMEKYFSPEQIADTLQVSRRTVYNWIQRGKLKAVKAGYVWRIPEGSLREFLKNSQGE